MGGGGGHLPVWPSWNMTTTSIQLSQHAGQRIYLGIQTPWTQGPPIRGEPLGMKQKQGEFKSLAPVPPPSTPPFQFSPVSAGVLHGTPPRRAPDHPVPRGPGNTAQMGGGKN